MNLSALRSSLSLPAYRWLWFDSLFGSMRLITLFVARGWLVLELTDSPFWVGLAVALRGVTQILLGAFVGVLLDRVNRRHALMVAEGGNSLVALVLGVLILTGQIELWHLLFAGVIEGMFVSVRWPVLNMLTYQIVGPERVLNASASNMFGFNLGSVTASAVAGLLIAEYGAGIGYLYAAGCGFIGVACLSFIKGNFLPQQGRQEAFRDALFGGLNYIRTHESVALLIFITFAMSFLGWSHISMLPVMARDVLGQDASGLGFLSAAGGVGALFATFAIAALGDYQDKMRLIRLSAATTALGLLLFAFSPWYPLSLVLQAILHAALMALESASTATVLLLTSEEMQGRVQSIYSLVFGFTWLGGVLLGTIATLSSAPIAIGLGAVAIGVVLAILWRPMTNIQIENGPHPQPQ